MKILDSIKARKHPRFADLQKAWLVIRAASDVGDLRDSEDACLAAELIANIYDADELAPRPEATPRIDLVTFLDDILGRLAEDWGWREREPHRRKFYPLTTRLGLFAPGSNQILESCARAIDEGRLDAAERAYFMLFGGPREPHKYVTANGSLRHVFPQGVTLAQHNAVARALGKPLLRDADVVGPTPGPRLSYREE